MTGGATGSEPERAMQIGEVAERTGLSLRTLRHYDEIGLLRPSARSSGGFRLYTAADLEQLMVIRRMKPLGFSLEEMHEVMHLLEASTHPRAAGPDADPPAAPQAAARLEEILADARARREKLQRQLAMADEFIDSLSAHMP